MLKKRLILIIREHEIKKYSNQGTKPNQGRVLKDVLSTVRSREQFKRN